MTLDEARLKALRQQDTRRASREGCLSADLLAMAADNTLPSSERARVADHLAACADCAEELQLIRPLQAWSERTAETYGRAPRPSADRGPLVWVWQLASLILVVAVGALLAWNVALRQDNLELVADRNIAPAPVPVTTAPAVPAMQTAVNVPIIDLQTDAFRSGTGGAVPAAPADALLATLILATDLRDASGAYRLAVVDAGGRTVWQSDALTMTEFNTFTVAVSPRELGAGLFRLELSRPGATRPLHVYQLRIAPKGAAK